MFHQRFLAMRTAGSGTFWMGILGTVLLGAWGLWLFRAQVSLYEISSEGRLEVESESRTVDAPAGGTVVANHLILGKEVGKGEILVEIDAESLRLELGRERTHFEALTPQVQSIEKELSEAGVAYREQLVAAVSTVQEADARQKAASALTRLRLAEREQIEKLARSEYVAAAEAERYRAQADQQVAETEALALALQRLTSEGRLKKSDRLAQIATRELELARLRGSQAEARARMAVLEREIFLRSVRAPVAGRVGDLQPVHPGTVVAAGARLATLVPLGRIRSVAYFAPEALGRIRPGQTARLRMQGFPWTKYGAVAARVTSAGNEPRDGRVRVELEVLPEKDSAIPMEHGLPASVEIVVQTVTPVDLALDVAGRFLERRSRR